MDHQVPENKCTYPYRGVMFQFLKFLGFRKQTEKKKKKKKKRTKERKMNKSRISSFQVNLNKIWISKPSIGLLIFGMQILLKFSGKVRISDALERQSRDCQRFM